MGSVSIGAECSTAADFDKHEVRGSQSVITANSVGETVRSVFAILRNKTRIDPDEPDKHTSGS